MGAAGGAGPWLPTRAAPSTARSTRALTSPHARAAHRDPYRYLVHLRDTLVDHFRHCQYYLGLRWVAMADLREFHRPQDRRTRPGLWERVGVVEAAADIDPIRGRVRRGPGGKG